MAKKNVFPLCGTGSKTFTPRNKIAGGKTITLGTLVVSETDDPDTLHASFSGGSFDGNFYSNSFYLGRISEALLDVSLPPQTDNNVVGSHQRNMAHPWQNIGSDPSSNLWADINGTKPHKEIPAEGSIFTVASKTSADSAWAATSNQFLTFLDPSGSSAFGPRYGIYELFNGPDGDVFISADFYSIEIPLGKWATYMFTGTRFVCLGSNGWY